MKRPLDVVVVVGPPVLWDGSELAREVGVVRGDADGGGGAVLRGAGEVGGVEREGVGDSGEAWITSASWSWKARSRSSAAAMIDAGPVLRFHIPRPSTSSSIKLIDNPCGGI
jgi:hypothetical protein